MKSLKVALAAGLLVSGGALLAPTTAYAADCPSAYSDNCREVHGHKIVKPPTVVEGERFTLPFTGGEIALMTLVGGGAIGAGTAFVVGGRRRRAATH